jgi:SAM-dependent methyltransferase
LKSDAGEAWAYFYRQPALSWFDLEKTDIHSIRRFARSEWISRMLGYTHLPKSAKILEAGCGTGMYSAALAFLGFEVNAFDYNEEAVRIAKSLYEKIRPLEPGIRLQAHRGNLLDIQWPSGSFDLVFNQAVLEYFPDRQRRQALEEMVRVTRPGGWVAVIVQHTAHPFRHFWKKIGWRGYTNQPPVIEYDPWKLKKELQETGLKDVRVDGIYPWKSFFVRPQWYKYWKWSENSIYLIGRGLERFCPLPVPLRARWAQQIIAVGKK